MPWFRERPIDEITRADVQRWLTALHATPAAAARSVPILSVILRQAEVYGHRPENTNPCTGVRRYRQRARERFVTTEEARRLGAALAARENTSPVPRSSPPPVAARVSPERIPRSSLPDYREGHCFSVTARPDRERCGCRRPHARRLDRLPRMGCWMFLESKGTGPLSGGTLDRSWRALREEAVLHNLRLHTCATAMQASRCDPVRQCSPLASCLDIAIRQVPSGIPTAPTRWPAMLSTRSAPPWGLMDGPADISRVRGRRMDPRQLCTLKAVDTETNGQRPAEATPSDLRIATARPD